MACRRQELRRQGRGGVDAARCAYRLLMLSHLLRGHILLAAVTRTPRNPVCSPSSTTAMASLFSRSLARTARPHAASRLIQRSLATSRTCRFEQETRSRLDYHTVEDLQGMPAHEILPEPGTKEDAKMRHFTGGRSVLDMICFCF